MDLRVKLPIHLINKAEELLKNGDFSQEVVLWKDFSKIFRENNKTGTRPDRRNS